VEFGFVGPTYQSEAMGADAQECINLYPEAIESGTGRAKYVLLGTPGTILHCTLPQSPIRGMWGGDNRLFAVAGTHLYEIFANGTYTDRSVPGFGGPYPASGVGPAGGPLALVPVGDPATYVDFASNGLQLLMTSGGHVYCDSGNGPVAQSFSVQVTDLIIGPAANQVNNATGNAFTSSDVGNTITFTEGDTGTWNLYTPFTITAVSSGTATLSGSAGTVGSTGGIGNESLIGDGLISARHCAFLDGYFIISGKDITTSQPSASKSIWISGFMDGTFWDAGLFLEKSGYPDNIANIMADHEELWIWGNSNSTEVWRNVGASPFPFQRDPSAFIHQACVAEYSVVSIQNGVAWIGGDTRGQPVAWFATGFQPVRISNHAVEQIWSTFPTPYSDAIGYSYVDRGHAFWVISFPGANQTWVWDALTNMWHRRGYWTGSNNPVNWDRQQGAFHAYEFGKNFVGAWNSGNIYWMDKGFFTDAGNAIYFRRTAPYIAHEQDRVSVDEFRLDYYYSNALTLTLALSPNGGVPPYGGGTWGPEKPPSGLKVYRADASWPAGCTWRRLGQSRSMLFRVTGHGGAPKQLINAYLNPND
jgi:hypothetical protein